MATVAALLASATSASANASASLGGAHIGGGGGGGPGSLGGGGVGVRRIYQLKCGSTFDAKTELAAVTQRLTTVLGGVRRGRWVCSTLLLGVRPIKAAPTATNTAAKPGVGGVGD